jgi:hypothetical protein
MMRSEGSTITILYWRTNYYAGLAKRKGGSLSHSTVAMLSFVSA